ncbi:hypothetical protein LIA77_07759 [Sarocladium implicatum]|nr:hypothetical protein LIA77_07759 [Sarocladium implicatum]
MQWDRWERRTEKRHATPCTHALTILSRSLLQDGEPRSNPPPPLEPSHPLATNFLVRLCAKSLADGGLPLEVLCSMVILAAEAPSTSMPLATSPITLHKGLENQPRGIAVEPECQIKECGLKRTQSRLALWICVALIASVSCATTRQLTVSPRICSYTAGEATAMLVAIRLGEVGQVDRELKHLSPQRQCAVACSFTHLLLLRSRQMMRMLVECPTCGAADVPVDRPDMYVSVGIPGS